jgi:outer membrane lipopolysaccharide assembly protein LptE/RlpB
MNYELKKLLFPLFILSLSACGYSFQGDVSNLPSDVRTVYIPIVQNKTTTPALSSQFTDMIKREFNHYGTLKVIDDKDIADAMLTVSIDEVRSRVSSVSGVNDTEVKSQVYIYVSANLTKRNGQIIWEVDRLSNSDSYATVRGTVVLTSPEFMQSGIDAKSISTLTPREIARGQSRETLERLMSELAKTIYMNAVANDF